MSGSRKLFRILGPVINRETQSPSRVYVCKMARMLVSAERSWRSPDWGGWHSSTRYDGAWPWSNW